MKNFILYSIFYFFFLFFSSVHCQKNQVETLLADLQNEELVFEKVFVHTNKTSYNVMDALWFKVYVATNDNKPSLKTSLVYVSLFAEDGRLIQTKNVYIENGMGNNQFLLDADLVSGTYYIQAYTKNMLNFGSDNKFITSVEIGNDQTEKTTSQLHYDIQYLPEGGYFLEGVQNVVGIKALINGNSGDYRGDILNSKNEKVAEFSSAYLGMSKTEFLYHKNETYKVVLEINDTIIKSELPKALKSGLVVTKIKGDNAMVTFEVRRNDERNLDDYVLLFHQQNNILDYLKVDLKNAVKKSFTFKNSSFFKGVNSITVLKNGQPILERKFFIPGVINSDFFIQKLNKIGDSTVYSLRIKDLNSEGNVSISVLANNSNYSNHTDIISAMHLTPYVTGYIENPSYYFNKEHTNREEHLDLLMLTQGWTQYANDQFLEKLNPKIKNEFENGFSIKGKLMPVLSGNLGIYNMNGDLLSKYALNGKAAFAIDNLVAYKGDSIQLAFVDDIGLTKTIKKVVYDSISNEDDTLAFEFQAIYKRKIMNTEGHHTSNSQPITYSSETNVLDEVDLKYRKKSKAVLERKKFNNAHRKEIFDIGAYYELEIPERFRHDDYTIEDYLLDEKGFTLYTYSDGFSTDVIKGLRIVNGYVVPFVIRVSIDGEESRISGLGMALRTALSMKLKNIEAILYKPAGRFLDKIAFFTTDDYKAGISNNFKVYVFEDGYDKPKKYYAPLYSQSVTSKNQEISWLPNLVVGKDGGAIFKINEAGLSEGLVFAIQGFSNQGELISGIYKVPITKVK